MRTIAALATAGFRELLHQKLLYGVLVFATLFVLGSLSVLPLSLGQWEHLLVDMGLAGIGIAISLEAVFVGSGLVAREIERKSLYFVLSKPVSRTQFLLGKFAALVTMIFVSALLMAALVAGVLALNAVPITPQFAAALVGALLEALILAAFALLCSSFTTPTLAAIFTLTAFAIGHLLHSVDFVFAQKAAPAVRVLGRVASTVMPNFELLNFKAHAASALPLAWAQVGHACLYGLGYTMVLLALGAAVLSVRDFK